MSDRVSDLLPNWLIRATQRLHNVTGFITVHPNGGDRRTVTFSRYDHVARVTALALSIGEGRELDKSEILLLSWLHDINRWPFAHNSERDRFEQADDIERFVAGRLPGTVVRQAVGVAAKHVAELRGPARAVLLADIVTGYIEDTLFTITGLNLSPSQLPDDVLDLLRLPVGDSDFLEELQHLYMQLNLELNVVGYSRNFNSLVFRATHKFLRDHNYFKMDPLEDADFWSQRSALRDNYMRRYIFPLNNEKVCHGELIRHTVVEPVLARLGTNAEGVFTTWTEVDLIAFAVQEHLATAATLSGLVPALDYVRKTEPHRAFI